MHWSKSKIDRKRLPFVAFREAQTTLVFFKDLCAPNEGIPTLAAELSKVWPIDSFEHFPRELWVSATSELI